MNIYRIHPFGEAPFTPPRSAEKGQGFDGILQRELAGGPAAVDTCRLNPATEALLSESSRVLDCLESFAADLADPAKTLKDMAPLVTEIEQRMEKLGNETAGQSDDDPQLRSILDTLQTTARVAVFKYQRGDFVG